ncbi:hypothetical protein [Leptolyngbya sp. FACHB-261]|uniref:hypothetical protein n=1 Tax=Leptolyngbya sp. FACHB-261 TaxID=2692806 RepID=UPI001F550C96|nr:hypothetical protein [Leptolyngbya sp. FACHB-261]
MAQQTVFSAHREAQSKALREARSWVASFRNNTALRGQFAIHPAGITATSLTEAQWQSLPEGIAIDVDNTTPQKPPGSIYSVTFSMKGTSTNLGRIALTSKNTKARRCVFVSTLLGNLRTESDENCLR